MKSLYFILSVILLVSSCSEPIVDTFGNISGIVRDSRTNEPVEGVKITLTPTGASQVTDLEGSFLFDNLEPQEFTLMFTKTGFETTSQKVSVKPGLSTSVQVVLSPARQALIVTPEELDFGKVQNSIRITLENPASGSLNWSVESSNSWLTVSQKSGTVSSKSYVNAIVSRAGLAAGSYDGSLTFTAGSSQTVIPVNMSVAVNEKPSVTAENYSSLTSNSVMLSGTLVSTGSDEVTSYGFCWATHSNPTINDNFITLGDSPVAKPFDAVVTGLDSETRYYFKAYAENSVGIAYSKSEITLTTKQTPVKATVTTGAITNISTSSASVSGRITSTGNSTITSYGHVWSTSATPTLENGKYSDFGEATQTKDFTTDMSGLSENTTYYVRTYAKNEAGISYGDVVSFKTKQTPVKATVTTGSITNISTNSASVSGRITSTGNSTVTNYGHVWSTSTTPTLENGKYSDFGTTTQPKDFSTDMSGLSENTTYYVRTYAKNEAGISYGNTVTFYIESLNPTSGLYAYYTFENSTANTVEGAPNGLAMNGPTYTNGVGGSKAIKFSASDNSHLKIPGDGIIDGTAFTISFWVKSGFVDGHVFHVESTPVMEADHTGKTQILTVFNGHLRFFNRGYFIDYAYNNNDLQSRPPFSHSILGPDWNMITISSEIQYITNNIKLYINGQLEDYISFQDYGTSYILNKGYNFLFGGKFSTNSKEVNAVSMTIDNLRIYSSRVLSDKEIANLYDYEK